MEVQSSLFGMITIAEEEVYTFSHGIPGFENHRSFVIMASKDDDPFAFLQSCSNPILNFIIVDPFLFYHEYDFEIPESAVIELGITSHQQVLIRSILNVSEQLDTATMNLVAPVIFNVENRKAKQVVLGRTAYSTKHPLVQDKEGMGE